MKGYLDFVVKTVDGRYNNKKSIEGEELILNTELENHNYVSRIAEVVYEPYKNKTGISVGDKVVVHHNVFRRFRDIRGEEKNSKSYYGDGMYIVQPNQVYAYKKAKNTDWVSCEGFNLIKPIKETKMFSSYFEKQLVGILKIKDPELNGLSEGDLVGFGPSSEYEFIIGTQRLYRVPTTSITIKYERTGNEEEYNPSWTESS
jgi:hypothetical protein|tara:strand:+ start:329 stop:934 length:606 start_codon:yes stop_codon:yes gene_type:complete